MDILPGRPFFRTIRHCGERSRMLSLGCSFRAVRIYGSRVTPIPRKKEKRERERKDIAFVVSAIVSYSISVGIVASTTMEYNSKECVGTESASMCPFAGVCVLVLVFVFVFVFILVLVKTGQRIFHGDENGQLQKQQRHQIRITVVKKPPSVTFPVSQCKHCKGAVKLDKSESFCFIHLWKGCNGERGRGIQFLSEFFQNEYPNKFTLGCRFSGQPRSHCQVAGTSPNNFRDHRGSHSLRHEALPVSYRSPPTLLSSSVSAAPPASPASSPSSSSNVDPTVQRGCALHPRLEHPVTTSTPGMDSKKIVQATTAVVAVGSSQVRNKNNDASGLAASVSGIRRRSGPQGLRSPAAKRPPSAPVHLQGWLHKQGSEGLMLWKKRWFVLSEYCLFYYKGPEEEKLLGSILLPSYRVTVCRPEDKVNRKFAFKAEHANMRTYHFAADNRESMNQWVNALTLATLLQDPSPGRGEVAVVIEIGGQPDGERSARPSVSSISSVLNQSADDSDSGFHGFLSRDDPSHASNNNSSPNSVNTASFPNLSGSNGNGNAASNNNNLKDVQQVANGWLQQSPQYGQSSSSQHQHPQYCFTEHLVSQQLQQAFRRSPVSPDVTITSKSPISDYDRNSVIYATRMSQPSQQSLRTDKSGLNYGYCQGQSTERRTPDTYGRSAKPRPNRGNGDYEEVYGIPQLYQRPAGPIVGYTKATAPAPIPIPTYAQHQQMQQQQQLHSPVTPPNVPIIRQPVAHQLPPPRPHSADFLEYEATRRPQQQNPVQKEGSTSQQKRPQRPKSSLDIINPSDATNDGYYYSEERYAAQMRQSAVYLHQTPQHHQQQRNQSLSRATVPSKLPTVHDRNGDIRMATLPDSSCSTLRRLQREHAHQHQHNISTQTLQRHNELSNNDAKLRRSLREKVYESCSRNAMTREYESSTNWNKSICQSNYGLTTIQSCQSGHSGPTKRWAEQQQQQFYRSASARLPRSRHPAALDEDDDDYGGRSSAEQDTRDGERKIQQREESMKRLLEWKQRMLQSPLTRKPSGSMNRSRAQNELSNYYKQQALLDLAAHEASVTEARHSRRKEDGHRSHIRSKSSDGRRTVTSVSRYNSYSSDDEEMGDVRRKRTRRPSHAGRSPRHVGDDRLSTATTQENSKTIQGSARTNVPAISSTQLVRSNNDSNITYNLSSIPPDAGYEEVSFPPSDSYFATSENRCDRNDDEGNLKNTLFNEESQHKHQSSSPLPKKPTGILKSSSLYGVEEQSTTMDNVETSYLNDYVPAETTWPSLQKTVQWNSNEDKEEWDSNIDESKLIKEFSYQYIQAEQACGKVDDRLLDKVEGRNLVRSRIRSFESNAESEDSPVKEMLTMQEALKASPVETSEAHVSRLDSTSKKTSSIIRSFALGEKGVEEPNISPVKNGGHAKQASTDSNKSVKDLLADFERKSQQVRRLEERDKRSQVLHRGVFSDTETLLYDTGSDLEQRDKSEERQEDDASRRTEPSGNKVETYLGTMRKKKGGSQARQKRSKSPCDSELSQELVQDENCNNATTTNPPLPKQEDPTPEEHYLPMTPRKAILDPNDDDSPNPKMMESLFANLEHEESSYVEMAQNNGTHSLLASGKESNDGDYSTLDASHYEFVCVSDSKMEPVYMEVSQLSGKEDKEDKDEDKTSSKKSKRRKNEDAAGRIVARSDLPDILTALKSDSSDADDESSKDFDSLDAPRHPRFSLSDTFRPASYYLGASRTMIAELHDSSDSELVSPPPIPTSPPPLEDLDDSLEMKKVSPRVTIRKENVSSVNSPKSWNRLDHGERDQRSPSRFSEISGEISASTFRGSRISLESASGSDSVSVELRNPEEEAARHRQLKRRPVSDELCEVLDSLDELESLGSRFEVDGTSIDLDRYLEELQARDAFNVDLYAKDLSYNSIYGFNENMLVVDKLQKTTCQDLARKRSTLNFGQPLRYDTRNKIGSASSLPSMRVCDVPPTPSHQHSQSFTGDAHYENISSFSPLRHSPAAIRSDNEQLSSREERVALVEDDRNSSGSLTGQRVVGGRSLENHETTDLGSNLLSTDNLASNRYPNVLLHHRSSSNSDQVQYPPSISNARSQKSQSYLSFLNDSEQRIQGDQSGAPYYYSDLRGSVGGNKDKPIVHSGHVSRLPQLNNQRDDASVMNKRNDIGRIVNPIARQMPRQIQVEDIDEARRIAAELRKTTCQLLGDTKADLVDKRNFYEADTLRRVKSTDPLPDVSLAEVNARNLYPHGLRDKSDGVRTDEPTDEPTEDASLLAQASHRRSRSLEGLLDDAGLQNLVEQRNRANRLLALSTRQAEERVPNASTTSERCSRTLTGNDDFNVVDPWEQDSLWRENLRRASLRNARSLDNLDSREAGSMPAGSSSSCSDSKTRPRITRGATYVNDSVAIRNENYLSSTLERPRVKRRINKEDTCVFQQTSYSVETNDPYGPYDAWDSTRNEQVYSKDISTDIEEEDDHFLVEGNLPSPPAIVEASGSGSVIGRDPLPPRAVSTSHLAERTLTQPPAVESTLSSTLPLPRSTATHRQQQQQHFPIHRSSPQEKQQQQDQQQQTLQRLQTAESLILRASSNGDIGTSIAQTNNNDMKNLKLLSPNSHPTQRLHSSSGHLRVIDLTDHRISSPSDNEIQVHSPIERKGIGAIGIDVDHGGGSATEINIRSNQRIRENTELLHKRSNANLAHQRRIASGSPTATAAAATRTATSTSTSTSTSTATSTSTPTTTPTPTPTPTPTLTPTQIGTSDLVRVSAGELLGRTHEELVLLLIQLRRQNATLLKAMDNCHMEIEAQARLAELDTPRRLENLQKLEELKRHLMDLEKQYEKGKPLVNLVDNMVKLGSLYNRNTANDSNSVTASHNDLFQENTKNHRDRLEFNQRVQEQRLLAEERRDWNRLSPDHGQLQAKVQQLYKLDRLLQEESGTLHSLQQDKEILEKALGGLRHKLQGSRSNLIEAERYRKQQLLLERELSRVRVLLAHNSKVKPILSSQKLEETVAENARLEQDLVVLRQKLQASRRYAGNITRDASGTTAPLETELRRVQQLVGDLQRQRKELSVQVQQLTEKSHSLVQQIRPQSSPAPPVHHSKKRTQNSWLETDLDSGITLDHGLGSPASPSFLSSTHGKQNLESPYRRYASPTQHKRPSSPNRQHIEQQQPSVQNSHNHISSLSPQLREQIQQHQLKQQLLKDQMQGKGSLMQINVSPLYVNTESRMQDTNKSNDSITSQTNGGPNLPPEYVPPPPLHPLNEETSLTNDNYRQNEDNKFPGLLHNREKQEIKTVRIVKRESERRQRDRGDRNGNIGIPLTNGLQAPGGAKRLSDDDIAGSQKFEKAQLGKVVEEAPIVHAQSTVHLTELDDMQFQRSMSLPRGFGGQRHQPSVHHIPVAPPPRSDSMHALKTIMMRRHKVKFENYDGSSDSTLSPHIDSPTSSSQLPISSPNYSSSPYNHPGSNQNYYSGQTTRDINQQQQRYYSPHLQYGQYENSTLFAKSSIALSPEAVSPNNCADVPSLDRPTVGLIVNANSASDSPQLSPVFKSEAARQIIKEMTERKVDGPRRRQVPKEKRRHYTVSSSKPVLDLEDNFSRMGMGRARDDLDMEQALRPRINAPDVVRSTLSHKELKYNESTIDQLLGTPNKIVIPERYIPEQTPELTAEEQEQRLKKADAIRKMLSETTVTAPNGTDDDDVNLDKSDTLKRKVVKEKRQREHILQLNQILAKQVMEKSKMVAALFVVDHSLLSQREASKNDHSPITDRIFLSSTVKALATLPLKTESSMEDEDLSPVTPLPLYQQRENYYS
ncbi:hypothetical protein M0802_011761 [Mischocyttarus mexicanus]|nr:hypothetical protein M0802_011761 [Mischocyttarus mexicanus]